jgi:hypothetical protein
LNKPIKTLRSKCSKRSTDPPLPPWNFLSCFECVSSRAGRSFRALLYTIFELRRYSFDRITTGKVGVSEFSIKSNRFSHSVYVGLSHRNSEKAFRFRDRVSESFGKFMSILVTARFFSAHRDHIVLSTFTPIDPSTWRITASRFHRPALTPFLGLFRFQPFINPSRTFL